MKEGGLGGWEFRWAPKFAGGCSPASPKPADRVGLRRGLGKGESLWEPLTASTGRALLREPS